MSQTVPGSAGRIHWQLWVTSKVSWICVRISGLKIELLVLAWKQRQATRAAVQVAIETSLDDGLPEPYDRATFARKTSAVFDHVFAFGRRDGQELV